MIGHSMGGLIGLYYAKKLGGAARIRKLIMMGTPVQGTWIALAGIATLGLWSTSSWQLLPRSRFLDELAAGPMPPDLEVYTLAAARDWVVPLARTKVQGSTPVTVPLGHSSLVVSEDVYQRLATILRPPGDERRRRAPADAGGRWLALPAHLALQFSRCSVLVCRADQRPRTMTDRPRFALRFISGKYQGGEFPCV
jgi:pimeloyl-ACP methyl ester carboxylesterase